MENLVLFIAIRWSWSNLHTRVRLNNELSNGVTGSHMGPLWFDEHEVQLGIQDSRRAIVSCEIEQAVLYDLHTLRVVLVCMQKSFWEWGRRKLLLLPSTSISSIMYTCKREGIILILKKQKEANESKWNHARHGWPFPSVVWYHRSELGESLKPEKSSSYFTIFKNYSQVQSTSHI